MTTESNGLSGGALTITEPDGKTQLYTGNVGWTGVLPSPSPLTPIAPTLPVTGTYSILLNPSGTSVGTATFTLYAVPPDVSGSLTMGAAPTTYVVSTPGQAIRATFTGTVGQSVEIGANASNTTPAGQCYTVTTLEPDGSTVLRGDTSCSANYSSGSMVLPATGSYMIVLRPNGTTIGSYAVAVSSP